MATATSAYRNSTETQSLKRGEFLSRDDIAELLDAADFSRDSEATIIRRSGREKGTRNYRRRHLVAALKGIWRASKRPYSSTGEILCFAAVEGYAIEAGVSERALRYNLRELEKIGVLQMVFAANTIRRPATYRLNISALRRRRTYEEVKKSRPPRRALHSVHHSSPPAQEPAKALPVNPAAPVAVAMASPEKSHRQILGGDRGARKIRETIVNEVTALMRPRKISGGETRSQYRLQLARSSIQPKGATSPDPWAEILNSLRRRVNPHSFDTWLKPTRLRVADGKQIFVAIPTKEFAHIGEKYRDSIQEAVTDLCLGYEEVAFEWTEPIAAEVPALRFREAVLTACESTGIPLAAALEATGWKQKFDGDQHVAVGSIAVNANLDGRPLNKAEQRRDSNLRVNERVKERLRVRFGEGELDEAEPSP
jgi:hypothetical protein